MADRPLLAIHQPNYLPWLGYFHKMEESDIFVLLDTVQYPRGQSFANRNRIKTPQGTAWLTVPVSVPSGRKGKAAYDEVTFADERWKRKHLRTLQMSYGKSPWFEEIYPLVAEEIERHETFVELNIALLTRLARYLQIDTELVRLSGLSGGYGEKTQLIIDLCQELGAEDYLSGTGGGREYNDEVRMAEEGITLHYSAFTHPEYPQMWDGFEPNLSAVDLLFNCGPESRKILYGSGAPE